ncbi:MAG: class I SAM-dependent methyltransferase [Candidatus Protochlamydia sp.]|nr:class I SAM-dependent methyltransferase [Candidatus Protochlamydia sp.]
MKQKKIPAPDFETVMPLLINQWRRFNKLSGPSDSLQTREFRSVVSAVQKLQKGLETGKELAGQDYFSEPDLLGAYLLYQWPLHYQEGLCLINELPTSPGRVLDLGSGPGAFAFAALRQGAKEVIAIDRNLSALQMAAEICGRYGYPLTIRKHDLRKPSLPVEGLFDLIIVSHCLEELFPDTQKDWPSSQKKWVEELLKRLTPNGFLLLAESSLLPSNRRLLALRDQLVKDNVPVQAPCIWKGECPSLQTKNSPCYAQRELEKPFLMKEIQRAAQINLGSLKMSYVIFKNPQSGPLQLPEDKLYRIISPPVDSQSGKRFYLCGTDGKKNLGSHLKEHPVESKAFDYLKRGELISFNDALEKGQFFDIVVGTRVKIEAALNKPYPYGEIDEW